MAKQKIQTEEAVPGVGADTFQETAPDPAAQTIPTDGNEPAATSAVETTANAPEPKHEKAAAPEKEPQKQTGEKADSFTLGVLKSFPNHESLYVDRHGGVFTPDTPKAIRGSATLYKNPYYKA